MAHPFFKSLHCFRIAERRDCSIVQLAQKLIPVRAGCDRFIHIDAARHWNAVNHSKISGSKNPHRFRVRLELSSTLPNSASNSFSRSTGGSGAGVGVSGLLEKKSRIPMIRFESKSRFACEGKFFGVYYEKAFRTASTREYHRHMKTCSICESPVLGSINAQLEAGVPLRKIASQSAFSRASLSRHARGCLNRQRTVQHGSKTDDLARSMPEVMSWPERKRRGRDRKRFKPLSDLSYTWH